MKDREAAQKQEAEEFIKNVHPDTLKRVFEMQSEKVPCTFCGAITKTDVHVEYRSGVAVFTKYVCPRCKHEFMEKDLHESKD